MQSLNAGTKNQSAMIVISHLASNKARERSIAWPLDECLQLNWWASERPGTITTKKKQKKKIIINYGTMPNKIRQSY